jgi:hypothetical protein
MINKVDLLSKCIKKNLIRMFKLILLIIKYKKDYYYRDIL